MLGVCADYKSAKVVHDALVEGYGGTICESRTCLAITYAIIKALDPYLIEASYAPCQKIEHASEE